ncbi:Cbb3-type cytochrome c oxidase subunit CcoP [Gemmobacter aquaticus]|jgi:cytochrome c oxidase cbb3-type subunit 3|uniref:Cbb3-type cytochrome c oxidase subunit n=1 Tax=Gemmobacter aquaticus TaxID=490185 RepID=A0A917YLK0_9RHOB|nr:cytochrome-c oxidase, cbb3-type subunit III [Gemmobacter aquaticus]GGO32794.1 Cbb3-type cytochrome c oxidase subunit CcoP [Gemmobacter aquaticus]
MCAKQVKKPGEVGTTGHEWDGIQEFDNPMPRWWLWTFYLTIIWAIGYSIYYPAWPMISRATQGIVGTESAGDTRLAVSDEIKRYDEANAPIKAKLTAADLNAIAADPELGPYAKSAGSAVFKTWCAQCHGAGAAGNVGFPNLLDDDWLWGGDMESIHTTITHGIRNTDDADARYSQMPAFGTDGLLDATQIGDVVEYVLQLSGQEHDATRAAAGATVFTDNCTACHMEDGTGDRAQGAPNLTDAVWLFGGDRAALTETVTKARFGVMPNWNTRLTEDEIRAVAVYVHSLGGGE